jgi:pyruvate dehydrogenase E2 component (dihydrolipoamide acetyltransferase)
MLFPDLETGAESGTGSAPVALDSQDSQQHEPRKQRKRVKATPIARKVARELNVSLDKVTGTGPNRTITQSDVRTFAESRRPVSKGLGETEEVEIVPLAGVRKKMAERMALSQRTQASVTTVAEVDMLSVQDLRKRIDATYTAFVVKAAALALRDFPLINASLRGEYLHYFKRIHINVAIDTERGLLVPVVRDADEKDLMSAVRVS